MGRLVCLVVKTDSGEYLDPVSGKRLECAADGAAIDKIVAAYRRIRDGEPVLRGGKEVKLSEMRLLATDTSGGELKARKRWQ